MYQKAEIGHSLAQQLSPEAAGRFQALKYKALDLVNSTNQGENFPLYTDHYAGHAERVVELAERLIPPQVREQLNGAEIFLLLCSAYLHDIGMSVLPEGTSPESVRERHGALSRCVIQQHRAQLPMTSAEANIVGALCNAHSQPDLAGISEEDNIGPHKIRTRFLAALLRLADTLDIDRARAPTLPRKGVPISDEVREWLRMSRSVSHVELRPADQRIVLRIAPAIDSEPDQVVSWVAKKAQEVKKCLEISSEELQANGVFYREVEVVLVDSPLASVAEPTQPEGKDD